MNAASVLRLMLSAGLLAFGAGFACFVRDAEHPSAWPGAADGIVALTGGALRVEAALTLLRAGVAPRLLVSGAGAGVTVPDLLQNADAPTLVRRPLVPITARIAARRGIITLGHTARTTEGNAVETSRWVHANGLHSLVVVTAGYHMRRAMAEIGTAVPDVRLTPYAVHPPVGVRTLLVEYVKLIAVEIGIPPLRQSTQTT